MQSAGSQATSTPTSSSSSYSPNRKHNNAHMVVPLPVNAFTRFCADFCRDFVCCGLVLKDLHALLQHFEDLHYTEDAPTSAAMFGHQQQQQKQQDFYSWEDSEQRYWKRLDLTEQQLKPWPPLTVSPQVVFVTKRRRLDVPPSSSLPTEFTHSRPKLCNTVGRPPIANSEGTVEKPYRCLVSGCGKAYKNANGLKYHRLHGHLTHSPLSAAAAAADTVAVAEVELLESTTVITSSSTTIATTATVTMETTALKRRQEEEEEDDDDDDDIPPSPPTSATSSVKGSSDEECKKWVCCICYKSYKHWNGFKYHMERQHGVAVGRKRG